jgi:hypothetical protein
MRSEVRTRYVTRRFGAGERGVPPGTRFTDEDALLYNSSVPPKMPQEK